MKYVWAFVGIVFSLLGFLFLVLGVYTLVGYYLPVHYLAPTFTTNPLLSTIWAFVFAFVGIFGGLNLVEAYTAKK